MKLPDMSDAYVCRETIYATIYAQSVGHLRKELIHCLRQGKNTCKSRRGEVDRVVAKSLTWSAYICVRLR